MFTNTPTVPEPASWRACSTMVLVASLRQSATLTHAIRLAAKTRLRSARSSASASVSRSALDVVRVALIATTCSASGPGASAAARAAVSTRRSWRWASSITTAASWASRPVSRFRVRSAPPVAAQQQPRAPHLRGGADDLAARRIEPPGEVEPDAAAQQRDPERAAAVRVVGGRAQAVEGRGQLAHDRVGVGLGRGEPPGEVARALVLIVHEHAPRRDEHEPARRAPRRVAVPGRDAPGPLGDRERMDVDDRRLAGAGRRHDRRRPPPVAQQRHGQLALPRVRAGAAVDGAEEAREALGDLVHRAAPSNGTSSPPPRWRARPSASRPPGKGASSPRLTAAWTATTRSPAPAR